MNCSCKPGVGATARHFDERRARAELAAYRSGGPRETTQGLLRELAHLRPTPESLLDVGCGIGALTLGMLKAGVGRAVCVDLSQAALTAGREEGQQQGVADRMELHAGDFVDLAAMLPSADLVTLDRVVCCYPDYVPLLEQAAAHSRRLLALSFPRDRWLVRLGLSAENTWRRLQGDRFRAVLHSPVAMAELVQRFGFTRIRAACTRMWQIEVYERNAT